MWKKLEEDERYWVSDNGAVRGARGTTLKPWIDRDGYEVVRIAGKTFRVHRLVALAFIGPRPDGCQIAHLDGNPTNNGVENLQYCTPAENIAHKAAHGTLARGSGNGNSRLREADVVDIKNRLRSGESTYSIAVDYGVVEGTIGHIKAGRTWSNL